MKKVKPLWNDWIIDVSMMPQKGLYTFCPCDNDGSIIIGMNYISPECPGDFKGLWHPDGIEKVEEWIRKNPELVRDIKENIKNESNKE